MSVETIVLTGEGLTGVPVTGEHALMMAALPRAVKLGRKAPAKKARKRLRLEDYMKAGGTPPPASINRRDRAAAAMAHMYCNDQLGCCVVSGKAHAFGLYSIDTDSGGIIQATDTEIRSQYSAWCGPGDNGCVITDVLDAIQKNGMKLGGKTYGIDGYVEVDWTNKLATQTAQYCFGATTIGINLPSAWTSAAVWDVTSTGIVGGHDVTPIDYDEKGVYVSSWGRIYLITWAAWTNRKWLEEYYAILSPVWYGSDKLAPSGIDAASLKADLAVFGSGGVPDIAPTPTPVPPDPTPVPPTPTPTAGSYKVCSATDYPTLQALVNASLSQGWTYAPGFMTNVPGFYQAMQRTTAAMEADAANIARINLADVRKYLELAVEVLTPAAMLMPKLRIVLVMLQVALSLLPASVPQPIGGN